MTAPDFAHSTLGFNLAGLNDMEKAKLMYLMHHEGPGGGKAFIKNKIAPTEDAKKKLKGTFVNQVGSSTVEKLVGLANDDVEAAYRNWLSRYVDDKFKNASGTYFCSSPTATAELSDLMQSIGGEPL